MYMINLIKEITWKFIGLVSGQSYDYFIIHSRILKLTFKELVLRIKYCITIYKLKGQIGLKKGFKNKIKFIIYLYYVKIYLFLKNNLYSEFAIVPNSMIFLKSVRHFYQPFLHDLPEIITEMPEVYSTNPNMIQFAKKYGFYETDIEKYEYFITDAAHPITYNETMKNMPYNITFSNHFTKDLNFFCTEYMEIETRNIKFQELFSTIKDSFNTNFIFYDDSEFYVHYFFFNNISFKPEYNEDINEVYERSLKDLFDMTEDTTDAEILGEKNKHLRQSISDELDRQYENIRTKKEIYAFKMTKLKSFFFPMSAKDFRESEEAILIRLGHHNDYNSGTDKKASVFMYGEGFLFIGQPFFLSGYFEIDDMYFCTFWDESMFEELKISPFKRYIMRSQINQQFTYLQEVILRVEYMRYLISKFSGDQKFYSTVDNYNKIKEHYYNVFKIESFTIIKKSSVDYPRNYFGIFHFILRNILMCTVVFYLWKYGLEFISKNRFKFYNLFEDRWDYPNTVHLYTLEEFYYLPLVLDDMFAEAFFLFLCFTLFHVFLALLLSKSLRTVFYLEFFNTCLFLIHLIIRVGYELSVGYRIYGFDVWWFIKLPMDHPLYIFLVDDDENDLTGTSFEGLSARDYNYEEDDIMPREHMELILKTGIYYEKFKEKLFEIRLSIKRKYYQTIEPIIYDWYVGYRLVEDQIFEDLLYILLNKTICGYIVFYSAFLIVFYSAQLLWWLYRKIKSILSSS